MKNLKVALIALASLFSFYAEASNPVVVFETTAGKIEIELYPEQAPVSVKNFLEYVDSKFYEETIVHRVVKDFVIQAGGLSKDLIEKPTLDPIINEANNGLKNVKWTVAYARTNDINSATSHFFINLKDNKHLDHVNESRFGYAVFGKIISGVAELEAIANVAVQTVGDYEDVPVAPIIISKVYKK